MPAGLTAGISMSFSFLQQHKLLQILTTADVEFFQRGGDIPLHRVGRDVHVIGNLLISPSASRQHGSGKLCGSQVVGHIVTRLRVMNSAPSCGKTIGNVDNSLEIIGPLWFDDSLQ